MHKMIAHLMWMIVIPSFAYGQNINLIAVNDNAVFIAGADVWQYTYEVKNNNPVPAPLNPFLILSVEQHSSHLFHDEIVTMLPGGTAYTADFSWSGSAFNPLPNFSDRNYTFIGLQQADGTAIPAGGMVTVQFTDPHPPAMARAAVAFGSAGFLAGNFRVVGNVVVPHVPPIPVLSPVGVFVLIIVLVACGMIILARRRFRMA